MSLSCAVKQLISVTGESVVANICYDVAVISTPIAILLSAFVAFAAVLLTITKNRIINRKRVAYDHILRTTTDPEYEKNEQIFVNLVKDSKLEATFNREFDSGDIELGEEKRRRVLSYINQYELLSIAVVSGIVDEDVCKAAIGDALTKRFDQMSGLINLIRGEKESPEYDPEFYQYLEAVAEEWRDNPKPKNHGWFLSIGMALFARRPKRYSALPKN